ncbi:MAG: hypothetical protein M1816_008240 [Peltula sp. TS41687]|nr:MAG: hypothetical protein M1816_008240 [Peltula sp. TS41687]
MRNLSDQVKYLGSRPFWAVNLILAAAPAGITFHFLKFNPFLVFFTNLIATVPLAALLRLLVEEIAKCIRISGSGRRTPRRRCLGEIWEQVFGNPFDLIFPIVAVVKHDVVTAQLALLGGVFVYLLLILGTVLLAVGWRNPTAKQPFSTAAAQTGGSLVAISFASLIIPTAWSTWSEGSQHENKADNLALSRGVSITLLVFYVCYLHFYAFTHPESEKLVCRPTIGALTARAGLVLGAVPLVPQADHPTRQVGKSETECDMDTVSIFLSIPLLLLAAAVSVLCSAAIVDTLQLVGPKWILSKAFVDLIILPVVGNAVEHITYAVTSGAGNDAIDSSIFHVTTSSNRIALLALPLTVILDWALPGSRDPVMSLLFDKFVITVLFVVMILVNCIFLSNSSHW